MTEKKIKIITEGGYIEVDLEKVKDYLPQAQVNAQGLVDAKFPPGLGIFIDQMHIDEEGNLIIITDD